MGFAKPISLILAWKQVTEKNRKAMNGEESLSLLRTLCTENQEGKQDLVFIGVIVGNVVQVITGGREQKVQESPAMVWMRCVAHRWEGTEK